MRRRAERDLDDEIRFDLAEESRRLIERGEPADSARASAQRGFGSVLRIKEQTREAWGWAEAERFVQDVRFAIRTVRTSPGFSVAAGLTLAIGLGLCSFLFNTLNALLLRPLPGARQPAQLVATQRPVSFAYFERYRGLGAVATAAAAYIGPVPFNVALDDNGDAAHVERVSGHLVSLEYFSTLGTRPLLGRLFDPDLERRGGRPTAVVTERFWRTRLDADARAIGRDIWINRQRTTIVGVAEEDFQGLFPITPADIFVPVTVDAAVAPELAGRALDNPASRLFRVVLRLAPGVDIKVAEAALDAATRQLDDAYGYRPPDREDNVSRRARLITAAGIAAYPAELRSLVVVFFGAMTVLILTFTCANIAGLVLARTSARRQEVALRLALGAGRARVVRQLLAESVVLAIAGGAGGLAATYAFVELLTRVVAASPLFRLAVQLTPDSRVAALTLLVAVAAGVALGLMPALAATRADLIGPLKGRLGAPPARYHRFGLRNLFMVYQLTAAMTLVVIMGFLVFGIQSGASRDAGFAAEGLSVLSMDPVRDGYTVDEAAGILAGLPDRLVAAGGVEAAALTDSPPFQQFALADRTAAIPSGSAAETVHRVAVQTVGPGFFATLGVPLQRGAEFSRRDFESTPGRAAVPAVINQTAAELFGVDPLGKIFRLEEKVLQVAGIVNYGLPPPFRAAPSPTIFLPLTVPDLQRPRPRGIPVMVRTREGDGTAQARAALNRIDASLTVFDVRLVHDQLDDLYMVVRYTQAVYGVVGVFALVLASVGLAGVTAHAAMRRRKEIGIRMALGARSVQVLGLVMREGAIITGLGACIGIAFAFGLARLLMAIDSQLGQAILLGMGTPMRLLVGPVILIAVTAIACYLPARRSTHLNPAVALRED